MNPLELGEMPEEFIEQDDGSVLIPGMEPVAPQVAFDENLAQVLQKATLQGLGTKYVDLIEKDRKAREKRDEQYQEGLRRTGLGNDAPQGAEFEGASTVVHPVLAEACVDFASRAIKELFPPQGPVKISIVGETTPEKMDRADRKRRFLNWQLTEQIKGYRQEFEQLLTQLPMGGSQYLKLFFDPASKKPGACFVPVDELVLPYAATSLLSAQRVTHRYLITREEFRSRVSTGLYADVFDPAVSTLPESTLAGVANDKIEGREDDGYNEDGLRAILEIYVKLDLGGEDPMAQGIAPYILTVDEDSGQVLSLYRNWEEGDTLLQPIDWIVEFVFIPWRGAYGIGLPHLIGGLSAALTGSLRALLDSAHINNAATMLKLKGTRVSGQSTSVDVTQICDIEGPANVDDIRKIAMPMPFNPPSPVLLELLNGMYSLAKGVVSAADDQLASIGDRTPVGTTMALIEQGSAIYSAVHGRLHESQRRVLKVLQYINKVYLAEQDLRDLGEELVQPQDFAMSQDIVPVSDPAIFSEAQRFAQMQATLQMSQDQSVNWNKLALYRRALKQMRVEAVDEILPPPPQPVTADPASENAAALQGGMQLKTAPEQDHMSHMQAHLAAISVPWVLMNPAVPLPAVQGIIGHITEHMQALVQQLTKVQVQAQLEQLVMQSGQQPPPQLIEQLAAQVYMQVLQATAEQLGQITAQLTAIEQQVRERTTPPQYPPEVQASIDIAKMEVSRKTAADQAQQELRMVELQAKNQLEQARQQFTATAEEMGLQLAAQKQALDETVAMQKLVLEDQAREMTAQIELLKNQADNHQKQTTELLKNRDDNATNLKIAMEKLQISMQESLVKVSQDTKLKAEEQQFTHQLEKLQLLLSQIGQEKSENALSQVLTTLSGSIEALSKPRQVVRGPDGKVTGVQTVKE